MHWRGNLLRLRWNIGHGKSSLTFAARAGSMRTVLHKRNLFAGERFDLDTLNHDNIDDRVSTLRRRFRSADRRHHCPCFKRVVVGPSQDGGMQVFSSR